ncbi:hypothetical protein ACWGVR_10440 [Streptomyces xanthophaeus]
MADFGDLDGASHMGEAFREAFPTWRDLRQAVAGRARYPEFDEQRGLQQVLMADLAHRITTDQSLGWLLVASLTLPVRPAEGHWPADFRIPGIDDIGQPYLMARSAFDLDLSASAVTDRDPARAAQLHRDTVLDAIRRVAAQPDHVGTAHGIGLGGLVRYTAGDLNIYPNGQVMGIVTAQPVDPRFGPRRTPAVDDPIPIEIDIKPPSKVTITGSPEPARRSVTAFELPGFASFQPMLNPAVNHLADKLVLLTGKLRALREGPGGPWHRYKDVYDIYFMMQTCRLDADRLREAVGTNWNLAPMGIEWVPVPYRFYGQDAAGPEPAVPWKEGVDALRSKSAQLHRYPGWDHMRAEISAFMDSLPSAPSGSTWVPGRGWTVHHSNGVVEGSGKGPARRVFTDAARSRSTTTPDSPRRKPPATPRASPAAPGAAPPRRDQGRGRG